MEKIILIILLLERVYFYAKSIKVQNPIIKLKKWLYSKMPKITQDQWHSVRLQAIEKFIVSEFDKQSVNFQESIWQHNPEYTEEEKKMLERKKVLFDQIKKHDNDLYHSFIFKHNKFLWVLKKVRFL